jgi:hypothetical protein
MAIGRTVDCLCCGRSGVHSGRGLIKRCYTWYYNRDMIDLWPRKTRHSDDVLTLWERYTRLDWSRREIANHLGMDMRALEQVVIRARRRQDPRAIKRDLPRAPVPQRRYPKRKRIRA